MKKRRFFLIAVTVFLLGGILIFSCKKSNTEDPNLTYIKNFYGVNIVHSFICLDPTNDTKSLQVDLVWDEKGVATYTTKEITRDTIIEHNSIIFMPQSEFNSIDGTIKPTKSVKTIFLTWSNGNLEPIDNLNCGTGYWDCNSCTSGPVHTIAVYNSTTQLIGTATICGNSYPYCYPYWHCTGNNTSEPVFIGWQSF
ncbi:MAG: hypothetical protein WAU24_11830 [Chitinophagaceae bacterium]